MAVLRPDCNIDWLESYPTDWKSMPLKRYFNFGKGLPITKADLIECGEKVISYGQIHAKYNTGVHIDSRLIRFVPSSYLETNYLSLCSKGDIIIADTSEDKDGCGNAVYVDTEEPIFAGYHTIILKSDKDNKYLSYLFLSDAWRSQIRKRVQGVKLFSITQKILNQCSIVLPPYEEQREIVKYLDDCCSKIDEIIAEATASIEEYKDLKQAVIFEAVTKGLDKKAPMKDSGIEWLPRVPVNWEVRRIASIYEESKETGRDDLPILLVSIHTGISDREIDDDERDRKVIRSQDKTIYKVVHKNYLAYNMMRAWQGGFGAATVDGLVSPAYVVARPRITVNSSYIENVLRTPNAIEHIRGLSYGVADFRLRLYWPYFKGIKIPLPSLEEQNRIVAHIQEQSAKIDALISEKQALIDDLQAYKKSLIYEVVTGKRRVV